MCVKHNFIEGDHCVFCTKCGLIRCNHKWEVSESYKATFFNTTKGIYKILKCSKCGDMKNHKLDYYD